MWHMKFLITGFFIINKHNHISVGEKKGDSWQFAKKNSQSFSEQLDCHIEFSTFDILSWSGKLCEPPPKKSLHFFNQPIWATGGLYLWKPKLLPTNLTLRALQQRFQQLGWPSKLGCHGPPKKDKKLQEMIGHRDIWSIFLNSVQLFFWSLALPVKNGSKTAEIQPFPTPRIFFANRKHVQQVGLATERSKASTLSTIKDHGTIHLAGNENSRLGLNGKVANSQIFISTWTSNHYCLFYIHVNIYIYIYISYMYI